MSDISDTLRACDYLLEQALRGKTKAQGVVRTNANGRHQSGRQQMRLTRDYNELPEDVKQEIWRLHGAGMNGAQIGNMLGISAPSARKYVRLFTRAGASLARPLFSTITGDDWARELKRARATPNRTAEEIRAKLNGRAS